MNLLQKLTLVAGTISMTLSTVHAQDVVAPLVKDNPKVIVLFYKPGCPFYQYIKPHFEALTKEYPSSGIRFEKIDISNQVSLYKNSYHFNTVPTVIYFKNGAPALSHGSNNRTITTEDMKNNIRMVLSK